MTALAFSVGDAPQPHLPPEQNLFLAVISVAVNDYRGSLTAVQSERLPARSAMQKHAEAWLFSPLHEEDFITVCRLADVEPEFVRSVARRAQEYTPTSPVVARRERLRKILPASTEFILERMPEYTIQHRTPNRSGAFERRDSRRESIMVRRDLKALGAVKVGGEWRIPTLNGGTS